MPLKQCVKCLEEKEHSEYYRRNDTGKLRGLCKKCVADRQKIYRQLNWEFLKEGKYQWQRANPEKRTKICRRYYDSHREEIRKYQKDYKRNKQSLEAKLISNYRGRIWKALKRGDKSETTIKLLGCSIETLKNHLEKKFKDGMTWDNYGEWHIDHIKPCSSFDFSKKSDQKKCFNYKNLQPLWELENKLKSDRVEYIYGSPAEK